MVESNPTVKTACERCCDVRCPIFRKKVTRSFAPQSSPINNENRHLIDVLKNTGQIELQFMHFQSDKKKQTQNEAHAHSAFSYFTRDRGTEKLFNRAGPGVGHDIDCSFCSLRWIFMMI